MTDAQVRLGVISEIHIAPPGTPDGRWHNPIVFERAAALFEQAVERCLAAGVDALAILGDLTNVADPESFAEVRRVLEPLDLPVYVLPGNHDLDPGGQPLAAFGQALDLPHVTTAPATVALTPRIDLLLTGLEPGAKTGYAAVHPASTGNEAHLTVVLTHFPLFAMKELLAGAELKHAGDVTNREPALTELAALPGPVLILNGHLHVHATMTEGRMLQLSVAALVEPPHDATLLTVTLDAGGLTVTREAIGLLDTPGARLPVLSAREECWRFEDGAWRQSAVSSPPG